MDDVIKRVGHVFGANEFFMLFSLSLAAIPTSFVIFLEIVTTEEPEVSLKSIQILLTRGKSKVYPNLANHLNL